VPKKKGELKGKKPTRQQARGETFPPGGPVGPWGGSVKWGVPKRTKSEEIRAVNREGDDKKVQTHAEGYEGDHNQRWEKTYQLEKGGVKKGKPKLKRGKLEGIKGSKLYGKNHISPRKGGTKE